MAVSPSHGIQIVHYAAPAVILLYYLLTSLWSVCTLDAPKNAVNARLNGATLWSTFAVIATFVRMLIRRCIE